MTILLGGGIFYCTLAGVFGGGSFVHAWWGRKCYTWKAELCDPATQIYPSLTINDVATNFRRVTEDVDSMSVSVADNPGICVRENTLTVDEEEMLMKEIRKYVQELGMPLHPEKVYSMENELKEGGLDPQFLHGTQFISDRFEDPRPPKADWKSGDSIQMDKVPAVLRHLKRKVQNEFPFIGELRHVLIEYSPDGRWYRRPKPPHPFDGHDYVVIPLLRNREIVTTFSPLLRSKASHGSELVVSSWTTRDIDVLCPSNSMMRVYGMARHRWGLGIRPVQWFGSPAFHIEDYAFQHLEKRGPWYAPLMFWQPKAPRRSDLMAEEKDEAILYLHYEGPSSADKVRRKWTKPEYMAFGTAPQAETYDAWDDAVPSEHMVEEQGIAWWIIRNMSNFVKHS